MIHSLFISRPLEEIPLLQHFCRDNSINLQAQSLIDFHSIPFEVQGSIDVIFFSSIRAAEFYLKSATIPESVVIACIGETTAGKLRKLGLNVQFVGDKAGNPDHVAEQFKNWLGPRTVLFPISTLSNRSISTALPQSQCTEVIVYETIESPLTIQPVDVYIFTSPSNLHSFLGVNEIQRGSTIIAWGKTTEKALREAGLDVAKTLMHSTENELIELLKKEFI